MHANPESSPLTFVLNGQPTAIDASTPWSLLDFLRDRGLTGSKEGCAEGECGACAVVLTMPRHGGSEYRAVNSCLIPLATIAGHEVLTVEGLALDGRLAHAQTALAAAGGSQCGYCTPGFVMSLFAEQYRPGRGAQCDPMALAGNLCRCTGYRPIRDAALSLGDPPPGMLLDRLARPTSPLAAVETDAFSRPRSVESCLATLAADPDATLIAGGTDIGVECNLNGLRFRHLVSLEAIDELAVFEETDDHVRIGAALPLADLGRRWVMAPLALREWLERFASPLIRHRATLGGNLATASPIGDAAPLLAALDASIEIASSDGRRLVPVTRFFTGYRQTVMARGELVTAIQIPKPLPSALEFYKIAKRRLDDISTLAAAFAMDWDDAGRVTRARFAFGGMAATPLCAEAAEAVVLGEAWDPPMVERVQQTFDQTFTPISDHRGSKDYRLAVSKRLVEKFWVEHQP
jgi:xanthine dehydrogenase small subunit